MGKLTRAELTSRLAFDWRVLRELRSPGLGQVTPYATTEDAAAGRALTDEQALEGRATIWDVVFTMAVITGPGSQTEGCTIRMHLTAGGNYPFSIPVVTVLSRPVPYSTHVHPESGSVCLGEAWQRAQGRMLAPQLVVHVMRVINLDEPDRGHPYMGWNAEAITYWRQTMRRKPFLPDLAYPMLPAAITHRGSVAARACGFTHIASASSGFRPAQRGFTPLRRS